jgi:hypothetical protein
MSLWLKAGGTAAEINGQGFARMWKLPGNHKNRAYRLGLS